jgi:hypothetical protein
MDTLEGKFELPPTSLTITCEVLQLLPIKVIEIEGGTLIMRKVLVLYNTGRHYNKITVTLFADFVDSLRVGFVYELSLNIQAAPTRDGSFISNINVYRINRVKREKLIEKQIQS